MCPFFYIYICGILHEFQSYDIIVACGLEVGWVVFVNMFYWFLFILYFLVHIVVLKQKDCLTLFCLTSQENLFCLRGGIYATPT